MLHATSAGDQNEGKAMVQPTSNERVQKHRARLRAQGLRPIQIWVPDTRGKEFAEECARQVALAAAADRAAPEALDFAEAAASDVAEIGDWT